MEKKKHEWETERAKLEAGRVKGDKELKTEREALTSEKDKNAKLQKEVEQLRGQVTELKQQVKQMSGAWLLWRKPEFKTMTAFTLKKEDVKDDFQGIFVLLRDNKIPLKRFSCVCL